jgi:hypothetical protein
LAVFGGSILIPRIRNETRWLRRIGVILIVLTGVLLFASGAVRYYNSTAFRIKMVLLLFILLDAALASPLSNRGKVRSAISFTLWAAVIFASRGIAFF